MDYTELLSELRHCADPDMSCSSCKRLAPECEMKIIGEAADAIDELDTLLDGVTADNEALCETIEKLKKPRWIPVTERLPKFGEEVLAVRHYANRCEVVTAHIAVEVDGYSWWSKTNITHWMPLPAQPGEEETE